MSKWKAEITDQDIDDIMSDALDGGMTAEWCDGVLVGDGEGYLGQYASDQISRGGVLQFLVKGSSPRKLDKLRFLTGLRKAIVDGWVPMADGKIDMSQMDAWSADAIVQFGVFGEVVYG